MAAKSKRHIPSRGKRPPSRPSRSAALSSKPFLRFYHSEELRRRTLAILAAIEQAQDATAHRDGLAEIVVELTNSGLDYYFMRTLKLAKTGFILQRSASLGMAAAQQVMASVIRQVIGRMQTPQLLSVCSSIRQFML